MTQSRPGLKFQPRGPFTLGICLVLAFVASAAEAQTQPKEQIPEVVAQQLRELGSQFEEALAQDCDASKCYAKGCTHEAHSVVFNKATNSLPGIDDPSIKSGGEPGQSALTGALCELTLEATVNDDFANKLKNRLEKRLSVGALHVRVRTIKLPELAKIVDDVSPTPSPAANAEPTAWSAARAMNDLWKVSLPFLPWLVTLFSITLATILLIWAVRRVGKESIEEQLLRVRRDEQQALPPPLPGDLETARPSRRIDANLIKEFFIKEPEILQEIAHEWLRRGEMDRLMHLQRLIGADGPQVLPKDVDFAQKLRLSQAAQRLSESDISDDDLLPLLEAEIQRYRLFHDSRLSAWAKLCETLPTGIVVGMIAAVPPEWGVLLAALLPETMWEQVAPRLPEVIQVSLVHAALNGIRVSDKDVDSLIDATQTYRETRRLPTLGHPEGYGSDLSGAGVVSELLGTLRGEGRKDALIAIHDLKPAEKPVWFTDIFFPEMLLSLPTRERDTLALELSPQDWRAWLDHRFNAAEKARFMTSLSPSVQAGFSNANQLAPPTEDQWRRAEQKIRILIGSWIKTGRLKIDTFLALSNGDSTKMLGPTHGS